jgi:hypothetical protein
MTQPENQFLRDQDLANHDPVFRRQLLRLHYLTMLARWVIVCLLWILIAPISLWSLRSEIALWLDYFTWTAVRYGLAYNPLPTIGLTLCIATTVSLLIRQSRNILLGIPKHHIHQLEKQLLRIRQQGPSHPLWKWVCKVKNP